MAQNIRNIIFRALRVLAKSMVDKMTRELLVPWLSEDSQNSATFGKRNNHMIWIVLIRLGLLVQGYQPEVVSTAK